MLLITLLIILIITTVFSLSYLETQSGRLAQRTKNIKAVHDCVHEYLPEMSKYDKYYNPGLLLFASPLVYYLGDYNIREFGNKFAYLFLPVMIFRSFTICLSIPTRTVVDVKRDFGTWMRQIVFGGESDLMFSGHIATAFCLILSMTACGIISSTSIWIFMLLVYGFFSSMTRSHYTIDVVVALLVVPLFYDYIFDESSKQLLFGICT